MKKSTSIVLSLIIILAGLGGLAWWLFKDGAIHKFLPKKDGGSTNGSTNKDTTSVYPLKKGSKGKEVSLLQEKLNKEISIMQMKKPFIYLGKKLQGISVDGNYGAITQAAVEWHFGAGKKSVTAKDIDSIKNNVSEGLVINWPDITNPNDRTIYNPHY